MEIQPEDGDLRVTQYILGEMSPAERSAFEADVAANPELAREVADMNAFSTSLGGALASVPMPSLAPGQRDQLLQGPATAKAAGLSSGWILSLGGGLAVAAALLIVFLPGLRQKNAPQEQVALRAPQKPTMEKRQELDLKDVAAVAPKPEMTDSKQAKVAAASAPKPAAAMAEEPSLMTVAPPPQAMKESRMAAKTSSVQTRKIAVEIPRYERLDLSDKKLWRHLSPEETALIKACVAQSSGFKTWGSTVPKNIIADPIPTNIGIRRQAGSKPDIFFSWNGSLLSIDDRLLCVPEEQAQTLKSIFTRWANEDNERVKQAILQQPLPLEYRVGSFKDGGSLSGLAREFYGDAKLWKLIYEANKKTLKSPDEVKDGMLLTIPKKAE
jgi:nucleoid-associated protein YgaU